MKKTLIALCLSVVCAHAVGASVILSKGVGGGAENTMFVTDRYMITIEGDPNHYMIMDLQTGEYFSVLRDEKIAIEMSGMPDFEKASSGGVPFASPASAKLSIKEVEKGVVLSGYKTTKYRIYADTQHCGTTWLSMDALNDAKLSYFLTQFHVHSDRSKAAYIAAGVEYEKCDDAMSSVSELYPTLGFAMKTVDSDGELLQEVVKINTDIDIDENSYAVGKDFQRMTYEEVLRIQGMDYSQADEVVERID